MDCYVISQASRAVNHSTTYRTSPSTLGFHVAIHVASTWPHYLLSNVSRSVNYICYNYKLDKDILFAKSYSYIKKVMLKCVCEKEEHEVASSVVTDLLNLRFDNPTRFLLFEINYIKDYYYLLL